MLDGSMRLSRNVRLRWLDSRPPPGPELSNRIDQVWARLRARDPELHDGMICTFESASPTEIVVGSASYREYAAQRADPSLETELRVVAVGVSGVARIATGVIVGRRAGVSHYRGAWELVPSGHLPADEGPADPREQLTNELAEETGIASRHIIETRLLALVPDPTTNTVDICARMDLDMSPVDLANALLVAPRTEYDEFQILGRDALAAFQSNPDVAFVPTSSVLLDEFGAQVWLKR